MNFDELIVGFMRNALREKLVGPLSEFTQYGQLQLDYNKYNGKY